MADIDDQLRRASHLGHLFMHSMPVQTKLVLGPAVDPYEQEADRLARDVVAQISSPTVASEPESFDPVQQVDEEELAPGQIRRKSLDLVGGGALDSELEASIHRARSGGQPLAEKLKGPMESAFGANFSGVRVHTDNAADQLNRSLQARAFTTGQDIFFRRGEYQPASSSGKHLLAHELTHVMQQNGSAVRAPEED